MFARITPTLLTLTIFLTACGPEATPTMSPADVQGTAVAAAWTMVAATQQAIPTDTPVPPTETPSPTPPPTFTPVALATLSTLPTATSVVVAAGTDTCLHPINMGEAGPMKRVRIENETGSTVTLSLTLWTPNTFGQCGAMSWADKPKYWTEIIEIPTGSWYAWAWIKNKNGESTASGSFVIGTSKSDDILRLVIKKEVIGFYGP